MFYLLEAETTVINSDAINDLDNVSIGEIFKNISAMSVFTTLLCIIFLIVLIVVFAKRKDKNKGHSFANELRSYMPMEKHQYTGNILLTRSGVSYSRGNRYCGFEIPIYKITYLAPKLVDPWFATRNYDQREAYVILEDIKTYLLENRICKEVKIVEDEDYDMFNDINKIESEIGYNLPQQDDKFE